MKALSCYWVLRLALLFNRALFNRAFSTGVFLTWASLGIFVVSSSLEGAEKTSSKDLQRSAVEWVQQLGDERFALRKQASRQLLKIGLPAISALQEGAQHLDREIRYRSRRRFPLER